MENTLQVGDRVMVNKLAYTFGDIERGDIVVFNGVDSWAPEIEVADSGNPITDATAVGGRRLRVREPPNEKDYIKRVIGLPGDHVQCCDKAGPDHRQRRARSTKRSTSSRATSRPRTPSTSGSPKTASG